MWKQGIKLIHLITTIHCINKPNKSTKDRFNEQEMVGLFMDSIPHSGHNENISNSSQREELQQRDIHDSDFIVIPDLIPVDKISTRNQILLDTYDGPEDYMKIDLSYFELTEVSPNIGKFTEVGNINLSNNNLKTLNWAFTKLIKLSKFDLHQNLIQTVPPIIASMKSLILLNLSRNQISELPTGIGNLTNLKILILDTNKFNTFPDAITNMKSLEYLSIANNPIKRIPSSIGNFKNLKSLDLSKTNVRRLPKEILEMRNLTILGLDLKAIEPFSMGNELGWYDILKSDESKFHLVDKDILKLTKKFVEVESVNLGWNISELSKLKSLSVIRYGHTLIEIMDMLSHIFDEHAYHKGKNCKNTVPAKAKTPSNDNKKSLSNNLTGSIINSDIVPSCNKENLKHFTELIISMANDNSPFVEIIKNLLDSIMIRILRLRVAKYKFLNTIIEELLCVGVTEHNRLIPSLVELNYQLYCINTPYEETIKHQSFADFVTDTVADIKEELVTYRLLRNANRNTCSYLFQSIIELDKYIGVGLSNVITQKELFSEFRQFLEVSASKRSFHESFFSLITDFFNFFNPSYVLNELANKIKDCKKIDEGYNFLYSRASSLEKILVKNKYFLMDSANKILDIKIEGVEEILVQLNILKRNRFNESNILGFVAEPLKYFKNSLFKF